MQETSAHIFLRRIWLVLFQTILKRLLRHERKTNAYLDTSLFAQFDSISYFRATRILQINRGNSATSKELQELEQAT
jgi:hypothetical protein